ncbi:MAG: hypothetical protein RLZZ123_1544, partial [Pseudomonadota bacterium]
HVKAGELIPTRLLSPLEIEQTLKQRAVISGMNGKEHEQTNS